MPHEAMRARAAAPSAPFMRAVAPRSTAARRVSKAVAAHVSQRFSLEALYVSHGPVVLRRARQLLGDEAEAQEVLHDVFMSLLQDPGQFGGLSSPMTFLYRMTTNAALGRLRRRRTHERLLAENNAGRDAPTQASPEALVELRALLLSLPDELARAAVYYHMDGMTQDELASVLGCSRQWVGKLLQQLAARERRRLGR
jgi:RNA polymerase sigma-70 factor (ECF subfamily)